MPFQVVELRADEHVELATMPLCELRAPYRWQVLTVPSNAAVSIESLRIGPIELLASRPWPTPHDVGGVAEVHARALRWAQRELAKLWLSETAPELVDSLLELWGPPCEAGTMVSMSLVNRECHTVRVYACVFARVFGVNESEGKARAAWESDQAATMTYIEQRRALDQLEGWDEWATATDES